MSKDWKLYALHIIDSIDKIDLIIHRGDITQDEILYDASLRNLQTMSEATTYLPQEKIKDYPDIPWKDIRGFRNILVHDYLGNIDSHTIMNIIKSHLIPLKNAVSNMLELSDV